MRDFPLTMQTPRTYLVSEPLIEDAIMWFTETAWPPIILLSIIAVGCLLTALQTQRAKWLVAVGLIALLAGAVWWIEKLIVTPAEQVEMNLLRLIADFQKHDEPQTLARISPASKGLIALAKVGLQIVDLDSAYRVTDVQIRTSANDTAAESHFRLNATIRLRNQGNVGHQPLRFLGKWKLEAGEWRLTEIEELDPINGEKLNRFHMLK